MVQLPPSLHIPSSSSTVSVRIIDTTSRVSGIPCSFFLSPSIAGHTELEIPCLSFLIEHPSGRKLLFDFGVRKDSHNFSPLIKERIKDWKTSTQRGVREQLEDHGVHGDDIEALIWSHWHWDHIGDPSTLEKSTALIVGPGFKNAFLPGYPAGLNSPVLESDYEGREMREIEFNSQIKIGRFDALDYFGDGSYYILDSPGHAVGHLCGLARVTTSPDSFIFMGGDICHHSGELRPSQYIPLPEIIIPNPLNRQSLLPCPGSLFHGILRDGNKATPFYTVISGNDVEEARNSIEKVIETDAHDNILVVIAHDSMLLHVVDFFPKYANNFLEKGWVEETRWLFLKDFKQALA